MTFQEFIYDHLGKIVLEILIMAAASGILFATGTQPDIITLLLVLICLVRMITLLTGFFKCRSHLEELESILSGLDQKYLFIECVPPSKTAYEHKLFMLMRRSYQSMTGAVSDAQAAVREYREYVESWVHEVKSPITAARLICHSIDAESGRRLAPELAQIEAHVERALFYARAESPEQDFIIRLTSLEEIVSASIESYRTLLMQNHMRIETQNLDHQVYTDSKWACFILGQLLQNAARYKSTDDSRAKSDSHVIAISAELQNKRELILKVSDNGIGIPAHELPRVFDRGFTGSNGRSKGGSTGMGLYLCRKLSGRLGIDIQITSVEHEGTCVTLTFLYKD